MSTPEIELWGLTGGIASGKSAIAKELEREGFTVIDADQVSRELSQPGGLAHPKIVARFGTADRQALRKLVFADEAARKDLEGILHPLIQSESARLAREAKGHVSRDGKRRVFYEASLLVEAGRTTGLHGLIVVEAPSAKRHDWLAARDRIAPEMIDAAFAAITAAQLSDAERRKHATLVIENTGTMEELLRKVTALIGSRGWK